MLLSLFLLFFFFVLLVIKFSVKIQLAVGQAQTASALYVGVGRYFWQTPPSLLGRALRKIRSQPVHSLAQGRRRLNVFFKLARNFVQEVQVFELEIMVGASEPFWHAWKCGALWALLGPFLSAWTKSIKFENNPRVMIGPDFKSPTTGLRFHCIFRFRLGQIIMNGLMAVARSLLFGTYEKEAHRFGK